MQYPSDDEVRRIRDAVAALPHPIGQVFRLHCVEGLDYRTIAERLDLDLPEVERLLAAALVAIDRHITQGTCDRGPVCIGPKSGGGWLHRWKRRLGFD